MGEWHVNYSEGITRIPEEAIRNQYIMPWLEAFPGVNMLMRRPFHIAEAYGMGLYNDMQLGHKESTEEWLTWIQEGGDYGQAEEKDALGSMPDFWKTAPSGGEFTSFCFHGADAGDRSGADCKNDGPEVSHYIFRTEICKTVSIKTAMTRCF